MKKIRNLLSRIKYQIVSFFINENYWKKRVEKNHQIEALKVVDLAYFTGGKGKLSTVTFLGEGSMLTDLLLLKSICGGIKDCKYFEIGTWRGESVANVCENTAISYTMNLSKEEMAKMQLPSDYIDIHGVLSKDNPKIIHLYGNTLTYDFEKLNQKFDVIFIDGDHHYKMVKNDTEKVFKHLVHENSIIVWHEYAFAPEKIRYEVFAAILDGTPKEIHSKIYQPSHTMCAIYWNKQIKTQEFTQNKPPKTLFNVEIEMNKL